MFSSLSFRLVMSVCSSIMASSALYFFKYSGSYSFSPSSQQMISVRCPEEKPSSDSMDLIIVVFPLSRKPVSMYTGMNS